MGWDAYATHEGKHLKTKRYAKKEGLYLENPRVRLIWANAEKEARKRSGGQVDGYLATGGLDCSNCEHVLRAAGVPTFGDALTPAQVRKIKPRWPPAKECKPEDKWAYWSARVFFDTCVQFEFGMLFSW